jgi:hypothetical protein
MPFRVRPTSRRDGLLAGREANRVSSNRSGSAIIQRDIQDSQLDVHLCLLGRWAYRGHIWDLMHTRASYAGKESRAITSRPYQIWCLGYRRACKRSTGQLTLAARRQLDIRSGFGLAHLSRLLDLHRRNMRN